MKTKNLFVLPALLAVLNLLPAGRVTAQTFTTLHSFTGGSDGASPQAGLVLSGSTLYGTGGYGGSSGRGTVFAVNTNGTGFTNLHSFTGGDGANPFAGLILSNNTLYGTSSHGSYSDYGTVFAVNTDGTAFTNLHSFNGSAGVRPYAGLILSGNTLYGTAIQGGSGNSGTVFAVNTDGTGSTNLHSFTALAQTYLSNSDGGYPRAGLILSGNTLYGTANSGGSSANGTVFKVNNNGTGFTNLHSFTAKVLDTDISSPIYGFYTNSDGAGPRAGLILSGNALFGTPYGTAAYGGSSGRGTVFAVNTDGSGFKTLHSFTAGSTNSSGVYTNTDGATPFAGLILSGNTLYGTASEGGSSGYGTVFAVNTDGTGFTNLHSFTGGDGANPDAGLIISGNSLYGTASQGGSSGNGTVFSLSFRPQLTITPSGTNVILSWPTNVAGFDYTGYTLQSTTNLVSSAVWSTNSPAPVVIAGQSTVTNLITGAQQFYRLVQ